MIDETFGYWFAGLTDGEGSFTLTYGNRPKFFPQPQFSLGFRDDEKKLIYMIQKHFGGIGSVYSNPKKYTNPQGYISNPVIMWMVNTRHDTQILVDFFHQYPLRSKKSRDFEVWAKAVELRNSGEWRGVRTPRIDAASAQMRKYAEELHRLKEYGA